MFLISVNEELGENAADQEINNSLNNAELSVGQTSTPLLDSPMLQRKVLDTSVNDTSITSPLAVFASSPQAMYRRVMVSFHLIFINKEILTNLSINESSQGLIKRLSF